MDSLKPLIGIEELKTSLLKQAMATSHPPVQSNYDELVDTLTILYVRPGADTFVYYIDGDVALVCDSESLEVVGFHIEAFVKNFLPKQTNRDLARSHAPWRIPELA
jgi:hypothetical protein